MAKYSFEFKLKIVQEYLEGKGVIAYLSKKYAIKSSNQVRNWLNAYREFGEEGLLRKRQNQNYSVQFKIDALELYLTSELSYREVANHFGMNNPALIANWMRIFRAEGMDVLSKTKGRPPTLPKKNEDNKKTKFKERSEEHNRIKELEKQVRSLQIENAFLKELRRLRLEDEEKMRERHSSSTVSDENSN